jgi:hypothetical protein
VCGQRDARADRFSNQRVPLSWVPREESFDSSRSHHMVIGLFSYSVMIRARTVSAENPVPRFAHSPVSPETKKFMIPVSAKINFREKTFGNRVQSLHIVSLKTLIQVDNNNMLVGYRHKYIRFFKMLHRFIL